MSNLGSNSHSVNTDLLTGDSKGADGRDGIDAPADVEISLYSQFGPGADALLFQYVVASPIDFVNVLLESKAYAGVVPTADYTLSVRVNDVQKVTINWLAGNSLPSITGAGFAVTTDDIITIVAALVPDDTIAEISITLRGTRYG